jgi:predicted GIY-YIG superfamily endonuclease
VRGYYVYILANRSRRLYIGVTSNLLVKLAQHRSGESEFTSRPGVERRSWLSSRA